MLYLIATPIGNLADMTFRAVEVLKTCDYVLCEDTRHSLPLLRHYGIHKPLRSYHKFNEKSQLASIIQDLQSGKCIGLISDAGTPGISDPGSILIEQCIQQNLPFTAIPGPCSVIQALCCSGLSAERFQFVGFLPRKTSELKHELQSLLSYNGTSICFESPHRLLDTLQLIQELSPDHHLVVGRELTKKFEEIARGNATHLINYWQTAPLKGEIVLLFSPPSNPIPDWSDWTPQEHVQMIQKMYGIDQQEAIKIVAQLRQVPKRQIYNLFHQKE